MLLIRSIFEIIYTILLNFAMKMWKSENMWPQMQSFLYFRTEELLLIPMEKLVKYIECMIRKLVVTSETFVGTNMNEMLLIS